MKFLFYGLLLYFTIFVSIILFIGVFNYYIIPLIIGRLL